MVAQISAETLVQKYRRAEPTRSTPHEPRAKKPGPRGPGLKFASVGAPANHLPEGKNCAHAVANLGGSRPRMSRSNACIMQTDPATHNAAVDMPAMRYRRSSGQLV